MRDIGSRFVKRLLILLISTAVGAAVVSAENLALKPKSQAEWKRTVNQGTVRILTEGLESPGTMVAADMAAVLSHPGRLRVLPVIGEGTVQSIADLIYLSAIEFGIMQADVLAYVRRNGIHPDIDERVRYVTRLGDKQVHLLASYGSKTIQDLDGKLVGVGLQGSGASVTADNLFGALGIDVLPIHYDRETAIDMVRQGEIAAALFVAEKGAPSIRVIEPGDGLHFLPVPIASDLEDSYDASALGHEDYPAMIGRGQKIQTITVPDVLAVYNWEPDSDRYAEAMSFVEGFLSRFQAFRQPSRLPLWQEVDLARELPGWQRFRPVDEWLDGETDTTDDADGTPAPPQRARDDGDGPRRLPAAADGDDDRAEPVQRNDDRYQRNRESLQERWEDDL